MNSAFSFVVVVIAIVMVARIAEIWLKQRKHEKADEGVAADMAAQIDQLEERIRVLERIVTEKPYDLKREIDRL